MNPSDIIFLAILAVMATLLWMMSRRPDRRWECTICGRKTRREYGRGRRENFVCNICEDHNSDF